MIKSLYMLLSLVAALLLSNCASNRDADLSVVPYDLSAFIDPFDTDGFRPAFSWKTNAGSANWKQSAWQIVVAESEESLQSMESITWNSHKVRDGQQLFIPFDGEKLATGKNISGKSGCGTTKTHLQTGVRHQAFAFRSIIAKTGKVNGSPMTSSVLHPCHC